jgi:hypothetical protein
MLTFLPAGLLGLVVTSLAAAYMSTMSTQVNWGSSIIVNDIYHRFFRPGASERRQVWAGRIATVVLMAVACTLALFLENALQVFNLILQIGAGTGLLFILRWFWWRVNAASELTAMIVSFAVAVAFQIGDGFGLASWQQLLSGVALTTVAWMSVAFFGPETEVDVLERFVRDIRPGGPGWRVVRERMSDLPTEAPSDIPIGLLAAAVGAIGIYAVLFATGYFLYGNGVAGAGMAILSGVSFIVLAVLWSRLRFE